MSTQGNFIPPGTPPCPGPMTRAALLALRTAGQLRTECHYIVTDGPVIGTAGNTSPTRIEMHAVSATELSDSVTVDTAFATQTSAWAGLYNIDLGASGTIYRLEDSWSNTVSDADSDAPTVHAQFPWHRGGANLRDNTVEDAVLPGWDTAGGTVTDNQITDSTVDLTGHSLGNFDRNTIRSSIVTVAQPTGFIRNNNLDQATVTNLATAGSFSLQNNTFLTGQLLVDSATTVNVTFNFNVVGSGHITRFVGKTGGVISVTGNRFFGNSAVGVESTYASGSGSFTVNNNNVTASRIVHDGPSSTNVQGCIMSGADIEQDPAVAATLSLVSCDLGAVTISLGPANAGSTNSFTNCVIKKGTITLNGPIAAPGRNDFTNVQCNVADWVVANTATAGLALTGGYYDSAKLRQNRTAGTGSMTLDSCRLSGTATTVTDSGTTDPGQPPSFTRCAFTDSTVTLGSLASRTAGNSVVVQQVDAIGSTLNVSGLSGNTFLDKGRLTGASLTTTFGIGVFEMLGGSKTTTAVNNNALFSPAYDNWV